MIFSLDGLRRHVTMVFVIIWSRGELLEEKDATYLCYDSYCSY